MFREVGQTVVHGLKQAVLYAPALLFAGVGGFMNWHYASTLGSTDETRLCWQAVAIGSALWTALAPGLIAKAIRQREWMRGAAASLLLVPTLLYDVCAAYGFAAREHALIEAKVNTPQRKHAAAQQALERAKLDLQPYITAPELGEAQATLDAIKDRLPAPCAKARSDYHRALCEKLTRADKELAQAEAKQRLNNALQKAQYLVEATRPPPAAADQRAAILGEAVVQWLPVILLTLGAFLGVFAVPSATVRRPARKQEESLQPETVDIAGDPLAALRAIAANPDQLPPGVIIDQRGRLCGTQRALAQAVGRPTTAINRALKAAERVKAVKLDKSGRATAIHFNA